MKESHKDLAIIAGVSAIAGARAALTPALLFPNNKVLTLMAAGELYVDKLPGIGDRIQADGLIGRGIAGAFTGAVVSHRRQRNPWFGALLGAAAAVTGAYITFYARKQFGKRTGSPDPVAGLVEDVAMICIGSLLLEKK
jgi:uncharacterized membrane protein